MVQQAFIADKGETGTGGGLQVEGDIRVWRREWSGDSRPWRRERHGPDPGAGAALPTAQKDVIGRLRQFAQKLDARPLSEQADLQKRCPCLQKFRAPVRILSYAFPVLVNGAKAFQWR